MSAINKMFWSSRQLLRRTPAAAKGALGSVRESHVVGVPPRNKVPAAEFYIMSGLLAIAMWTTPAYVLYHIPDYQNEERNKYTGK